MHTPRVLQGGARYARMYDDFSFYSEPTVQLRFLKPATLAWLQSLPVVHEPSSFPRRCCTTLRVSSVFRLHRFLVRRSSDIASRA